MSTTEKILAKMRNNPRDWRIEALESLAKRFGLLVRNPDGSHVVFSATSIGQEISVPTRKPIKPIYVKKFIALLDALRE